MALTPMIKPPGWPTKGVAIKPCTRQDMPEIKHDGVVAGAMFGTLGGAMLTGDLDGAMLGGAFFGGWDA